MVMGRIIASVTIANIGDPADQLRCDALVDTGASHIVLPSAWRDRLGDLESFVAECLGVKLPLRPDAGEHRDGAS